MIFDISEPIKYKTNSSFNTFTKEIKDNNARLSYSVNDYQSNNGELRKKVQGQFEYKQKNDCKDSICNSNQELIEEYEYIFTWKTMVVLLFLIISVYELYSYYSNISIELDHKIDKCMKEYYNNKCNIYHDENESNELYFSTYLVDFCNEKLKCISSNQVIFIESWLNKVSTYSLFLSSLVVILTMLLFRKCC